MKEKYPDLYEYSARMFLICFMYIIFLRNTFTNFGLSNQHETVTYSKAYPLPSSKFINLSEAGG